MSIEKFTGSFTKEQLGVTILPTKTIQFLRDESLMLWAYLASKHDDWEPNQKEIQKHFGWGERKTRNLFTKLTTLGLLVVTKIRKSGMFQNVHYHLNLTIPDHINTDLSPSVGLRPVVDRPAVSAVHTKHREQNIELTKKPLCPSQAIDEAKGLDKKRSKTSKTLEPTNYSEEFLDFWYIYPRKAGKSTAFKSWLKIPTEQNKKDLLTNLEKLLPELNTRESKHIKMPASYINSKPWEDEEGEQEQQYEKISSFNSKLKDYDSLK
jgi:hypothetical protein